MAGTCALSLIPLVLLRPLYGTIATTITTTHEDADKYTNEHGNTKRTEEEREEKDYLYAKL